MKISTKVMILLTNNNVKKAMRNIKTEEELTKFQNKWRCKLVEHQGILIFDSVVQRERFLSEFGKKGK